MPKINPARTEYVGLFPKTRMLKGLYRIFRRITSDGKTVYVAIDRQDTIAAEAQNLGSLYNKLAIGHQDTIAAEIDYLDSKINNLQ